MYIFIHWFITCGWVTCPGAHQHVTLTLILNLISERCTEFAHCDSSPGKQTDCWNVGFSGWSLPIIFLLLTAAGCLPAPWHIMLSTEHKRASCKCWHVVTDSLRTFSVQLKYWRWFHHHCSYKMTLVLPSRKCKNYIASALTSILNSS